MFAQWQTFALSCVAHKAQSPFWGACHSQQVRVAQALSATFSGRRHGNPQQVLLFPDKGRVPFNFFRVYLVGARAHLQCNLRTCSAWAKDCLFYGDAGLLCLAFLLAVTRW